MVWFKNAPPPAEGKPKSKTSSKGKGEKGVASDSREQEGAEQDTPTDQEVEGKEEQKITSADAT